MKFKFLIFLLMLLFVTNICSFYILSNKVYKYNKVNYEAMVCLQDPECSLEPIVDTE